MGARAVGCPKGQSGGVKPEQWPQWMRGMKDY
jgi:hypothetical protein